VPATRLRVGVYGRDWVSFAALAGYGLLAFLYLGLWLITGSGSRYLGFRSDPKAFIWCFGWWPHAILNGQNPFVSHALWAPSGVNLLWTASIPGLALLFAPLTLLVGPVVSYNVASVLLPALAAWTAFLLCRYLTHAIWPSLVGGYLFGFSSYVLAQEGHPNISAVFLVPLLVLVIVRFVENDLGGRGLMLRLGPLFGLEFLISTEITFTFALGTLAIVALGAALVPNRRQRLGELFKPLFGAALIAAVLTAPFVYYAISGLQSTPFHDQNHYVTDLLNFVVPTKVALSSLVWGKSISSRFPGNYSEQDGFLGPPALLVVALFAVRAVRTPSGRLLLAALTLAAICSLGARLTIDGHRSISLPWSLVASWPLFDNVLPARLALYVTLLTAVIVSSWTAARPPGPVRWLLPALAAVILVPKLDSGLWNSRYTIQPFFTASAYRSCLRRDENILPLPVGAQGESMLWQALGGYRFRMAGGNIAPHPPALFLAPYWVELVAEGYPVPASQTGELAFYIRAKKVTSVVVDAREASRWGAALDRIAVPHRLGGVIVYHISDGSPRCTGG